MRRVVLSSCLVVSTTFPRCTPSCSSVPWHSLNPNSGYRGRQSSLAMTFRCAVAELLPTSGCISMRRSMLQPIWLEMGRQSFPGWFTSHSSYSSSSDLTQWMLDGSSLTEQLMAVRNLYQRLLGLLQDRTLVGPIPSVEVETLHTLVLRDFKSICASLLVVFEDEDHYAQLLTKSADHLQNFLDLLQEVCCSSHPPVRYAISPVVCRPLTFLNCH